MFHEAIWPNLTYSENCSRYSWPLVIQTVLYEILCRIPKEKSKDWLDFLENTNINILFRGSNEEFVSKRFAADSIKFTETVCRCGVVSANKSGYSNHKGQTNDPTCHAINLMKASRIFHAMNSKSLICDKCGKECKSSSGLALHVKKCDDPDGANFRNARNACQKPPAEEPGFSHSGDVKELQSSVSRQYSGQE